MKEFLKKLSKNKLRIFEYALLILLSTILLCAIFLNVAKRKEYSKIIDEAASKFKIEKSLIYAVIKAESNFNPRAKSGKGALGLMQITEATYEYTVYIYGLGFSKKDILKPKENVFTGAAYLNYLFERFHTETEVLAAYNAGEGTVRTWLLNKDYSDDGKTLKRVPYAETENYIRRVKKYRDYYRGRINESGSSKSNRSKSTLRRKIDKRNRKGLSGLLWRSKRRYRR